MNDIVASPTPTADAEYMVELEGIMAEIRHHEATFDKLQAEIVAMQEDAERKAARGDALQQAVNRQIKAIWGTP